MKKRNSNSLLQQWLNENSVITPQVATVIQAITTLGNGVPLRLIAGYEASVEAAINAKVVMIVEDCLYLTAKGNQTIQTLITLAKADGEVRY